MRRRMPSSSSTCATSEAMQLVSNNTTATVASNRWQKNSSSAKVDNQKWTAPLPSVFNCWYGYYILDGCVKLLTTRTEPTNGFLKQPYNETVPELSSDPRVHVIHWSGNRKQGHPSFWELDFSLVANGKPGIRSPTTFVRPSKESQHTGPTHLALARALTQYQTHVDAALNKLGYVTFMQHARAAPPPPPGSQLEPQDSRGKRIYPNHPANRTKLADWAP